MEKFAFLSFFFIEINCTSCPLAAISFYASGFTRAGGVEFVFIIRSNWLYAGIIMDTSDLAPGQLAQGFNFLIPRLNNCILAWC